MTSTGTAADALRERWRDRSARSTWARPEDWYVPAVEALAEALAEEVVESRGVEAAADRLGRQRADEGVGLGEALDDLTSLYLSAGVLQPAAGGAGLGRGLGRRGGRPRAHGRLRGRPDRTGHSRLPAHPAARDLRRRAALRHPGQRDQLSGGAGRHLFPVDPWQRMARGVVLAAALGEVFHSGEPLAALSGGRVVALAPRDASLGLAVRQLRETVEVRVAPAGLAAAVRRPPRVWVEGLPADHTSAVMLLIELER